MTIATAIRNSREAAGLTQQQLADQLGLKRQTIINYESGQQVPKMDLFLRIARLVKMPETQLDGFHLVSRVPEGINKEQLCFDFDIEKKIPCESVGITTSRNAIVLRIVRSSA